jgi:photosystem II stability/assembly factor-like uncharacterized protein
VDPTNSQVLLFASRGPDANQAGEDDTEGLWRTADGGATWEQISVTVGNWINGGKGLRFNALDPERVFVGQESDTRWWISEDSGESFTAGDSTPVHIIDFDFDPLDSDIIYVGTDRAVYKSLDAGLTWTHLDDNGLPGWGPPSSTAGAVVADPDHSGTVYAGFLYGAYTSIWGVYKTTDGGQNWVAKNAGLPETGYPLQDRAIEDVALARSDPDVLYAALAFVPKIFKTTDGAESWVEIVSETFPDRFNAAGARARTVVVDPQDSRRLFVSTQEYKVVFSNDGGRNFQNLGYLPEVEELDDGQARVTMPDGSTQTNLTVSTAVARSFGNPNRIVIDPQDPRTIYAPSALGLYKRRILEPVRTLRLATTANDVDLAWGAVPEAASYRVYASDTTSALRASWTVLGDTSSTGFTDAGAAFLPDRHYSVVALEAEGHLGEW